MARLRPPRPGSRVGQRANPARPRVRGRRQRQRRLRPRLLPRSRPAVLRPARPQRHDLRPGVLLVDDRHVPEPLLPPRGAVGRHEGRHAAHRGRRLRLADDNRQAARRGRERRRLLHRRSGRRLLGPADAAAGSADRRLLLRRCGGPPAPCRLPRPWVHLGHAHRRPPARGHAHRPVVHGDTRAGVPSVTALVEGRVLHHLRRVGRVLGPRAARRPGRRPGVRRRPRELLAVRLPHPRDHDVAVRAARLRRPPGLRPHVDLSASWSGASSARPRRGRPARVGGSRPATASPTTSARRSARCGSTTSCSTRSRFRSPSSLPCEGQYFQDVPVLVDLEDRLAEHPMADPALLERFESFGFRLGPSTTLAELTS